HARQLEIVTADRVRVRTNGQVAAAAELGQEGALGIDGPPRWSVVNDDDRFPRGHVVDPALDGEGALRDLGQHHPRIQRFSPGVGAEGRSFAEWTATSARPSSTAACTSFTKTPCPPISQMGTSARRSPLVSTTTASISRPSRSPT